MLFRAVALAAFASTALALQLNDKHMHFHEARGLNVLEARQQGGKFTPPTTTATGDTCADAFGAGYITCRDATATTNRLCYNPSIGQSCCSNTWACPSGSFCLANSNGNCCPNGLDPNTCAAIISSSQAAASSSAKNAIASSNSTTTVTSTSTATETLPCLSTASISASANGTKVIGSTGKPSPTSTSSGQFTGAGSRLELSIAGLVGIAGLVAGLL